MKLKNKKLNHIKEPKTPPRCTKHMRELTCSGGASSRDLIQTKTEFFIAGVGKQKPGNSQGKFQNNCYDLYLLREMH